MRQIGRRAPRKKPFALKQSRAFAAFVLGIAPLRVAVAESESVARVDRRCYGAPPGWNREGSRRARASARSVNRPWHGAASVHLRWAWFYSPPSLLL